jgi:CheY-like chemotaxis protein
MTPPALSRRILLVDDDHDARFIYQSALEHAGHRVLTASDGAEAVHLASHHELDVVLMDVMMPGLDGVAAVHAIRSTAGTRNLPVIAVTAMAVGDDLQTIRTAGFDEVIVKPAEPAQIVDAVARWTSRPPAPLIPLPSDRNELRPI